MLHKEHFKGGLLLAFSEKRQFNDHNFEQLLLREHFNQSWISVQPNTLHISKLISIYYFHSNLTLENTLTLTVPIIFLKYGMHLDIFITNMNETYKGNGLLCAQ